MNRKINPKESKFLNGYLKNAFAKNIAKKEAKRLIYKAETTANLWVF